MTFTEIITEINDLGWLVNYIRQHTPDQWEAHLRNPTITAEEAAAGYIYTVSFASATTAEEALFNALTFGERKLVAAPTKHIYDLRLDAKPSSLLNSLGLTKPTTPINRRI